ncbi:chitinase [Seminavis robusta]|uniref:Chitinase n=1 Tax=Seminavis robusta TaxID=568900 RepID=A0A9N8DU51_9STRA|nr:chitinase [Seminavis robusta]|eukprot:Sro345_g122380.1 chitinase (723) ;mRNA; f:8266-11058
MSKPRHTSYRGDTVGTLLLVLLLASTVSVVVAQQQCNGDLFSCPDGSLVGRVPPECDFSPCGGGVQCNNDIFRCPGGVEVVRQPPTCEFEDCPGCPDDSFVCVDGTELFRDPTLDCQFPPCPPQQCAQDIFTCDDDTELVRDPDLNCEFPPCPTPVCPLDSFTCDDGTELIRDPDLDCEFPECPTPVCPLDSFTCDDGTELIRDPDLDCEFPECPTPACPQDIKVCPDGTELTRTEPDCQFPDCPPPACPADTITCPGGDVIIRIPPECNFPDCPPVTCNQDLIQCPDGSFVSRVPPTCEFEDCPEIETCDTDVKECFNGTFVSRVPPECNFPPCPPLVCPADVLECSDGSVVSRDPSLDCEFPPCPKPDVCTQDVKQCPNGVFLSRDPNLNCAFPPCPMTEYFMLAAASDGCIGRRDFMAGSELLLKECSFDDDAVLWRQDLEGRFHSKSDDSMCIQAGQVPEISTGVDGLMSGNSMYLKPCNQNLKMELQVFDESWTVAGMSGPLFLRAREDLCVVHFGAIPEIGEDRIMLLSCNQLGGDRALGWTALYPNYNYVTLRAAGGGCLARKGRGTGGDLFLDSCSSDDFNLQWRLDMEGRFRSRLDDSECMQAAQYPALMLGPDALGQGTPMYAKGCNGPLKPPFQIMAIPTLPATQGHIKVASRPDLCVTHFGAVAEIGQSRIILAECNVLGGFRGRGWIAEDPCIHPPFCQPATLPSSNFP